MSDLTTDAMTEAVEASASVARSAPILLRIVLRLLMAGLGAILWLVTTILLPEHHHPRERARRQAHARR